MLFKKNDWALVTGASSGIGWEFSKQIARLGLHLVAVARRADRLEALKQAIQNSGDDIRVEVIPLDLRLPGAASELRRQADALGIRIRLLVNNAGIGLWGPMEEHSAYDHAGIIAVNNAAVVSLCREFFEHLYSQVPSAVINVSSQAAIQPLPYMAVYGASKAFIHSFSLALYQEWKRHGIHVQTLVPGPTETEFDKKAGVQAFGLGRRSAPSQCVELSLRSLEKKSPLVVAAKGMRVQRLFAFLFPTRFVLAKVADMFKPPGT